MLRRFAQLEILCDEFDVEHAAAAMLHVPEWGLAMFVGDALAHVVDLEDEFLLACAGEDRAYLGADRVAQPRRAGDHARPGQSHMLPGPGELLMIFPECREGRRGRAR